jgi:hypothetical protein
MEYGIYHVLLVHDERLASGASRFSTSGNWPIRGLHATRHCQASEIEWYAVYAELS